MERIRDRKPAGMNSGTVRTWGLLLAAAGIIGRGLIQNCVLGLGSLTSDALLNALQDDAMMAYATIALVLQLLETCAVPVFAFLTVEGYQRTSGFGAYLVRVAALAAISEIPYNLAMSGRFLDFSSRNPVFGVVLTLVVLYLFDRYAGKDLKNVFIKLAVFLAAMVWNTMLGIEYGGSLIVIASMLWFFRNKRGLQLVAGISAAVACSMTNMFFLASPMVFLLLHYYNGEPGNLTRTSRYAFYPVTLLAVGIIGLFAF